jgi:AcrR family transcriptional regulator
MREAVAEAPALRRDQLLGAAALLFRRRGYHSVGVDDIGAAVGMSGPAVYRYFPSKQALLRDVIAVYLVALDAERTERNERDPGTEHVLDAAIWAGQRLPDYLVAYNRELTSLDPANRAEVRSLAAGTSAGWAEFLVQHSVERHSDAGSLRLQAVAGVLLHLSLTRTGSKTRRAALAERLVAGLLDAPLPALGPERPELPRQPVRHVTTREALLAAAAALFQDRDFSRVSLRDIGASVGLTASAVSRQFESKDQLMAAIFDRATEQICATIAAALRTSSTGDEAAREIMRRYVATALDFRDLITITSTQLYALAEPQRQARIRNRRMYIDELAHALQLACPEATPEESRLRAGAAYSLVNEVVMHPRLWRLAGMDRALTDLAQAALGLRSLSDERSGTAGFPEQRPSGENSGGRLPRFS